MDLGRCSGARPNQWKSALQGGWNSPRQVSLYNVNLRYECIRFPISVIIVKGQADAAVVLMFLSFICFFVIMATSITLIPVEESPQAVR